MLLFLVSYLIFLVLSRNKLVFQLTTGYHSLWNLMNTYYVNYLRYRPWYKKATDVTAAIIRYTNFSTCNTQSSLLGTHRLLYLELGTLTPPHNGSISPIVLLCCVNGK